MFINFHVLYICGNLSWILSSVPLCVPLLVPCLSLCLSPCLSPVCSPVCSPCLSPCLYPCPPAPSVISSFRLMISALDLASLAGPPGHPFLYFISPLGDSGPGSCACPWHPFSLFLYSTFFFFKHASVVAISFRDPCKPVDGVKVFWSITCS